MTEEPPKDDPHAAETVDPATAPARVGARARLGADVRPESIGPYRILDTLGEGGMGIVYLAQQEQPFRRKVALKIIKLGMDTRQVIARFEAERQALSMMEHPGLARVYDAGATDTGRPYFVMEHVPGVPITDYCDREKLTTAERLALFIQVCDAVQHAHQQGIIHRDLKPSNVLVAIKHGRPQAKVIDFGVAKATSHRLTERTVFTEEGQLIGTPEYMSPEQAEMTGLNIDTRTDIYSLGILLYQLLTGSLPFDPRQLRAAGVDEIRRRIREDEPQRPSTRLSTLGGPTTVAASNRRTDARALGRELRGELDWITMKALEKNRTRRYASASELAADIRRHMLHEPVLAGPPSTVYRFSKLVRRHRAIFTTFAAIASVLIVATIFSANWAVKANAARRAAERGKVELEQALGAVTAAKAESDRLRDQAQWQSYLANLIAADSALRLDESAAAERHLDDAPAHLRNWEWARLRGSADGRLAVLTGHGGPVAAVAFSPDGKYLASGGGDRAIRIWEGATGKALGTWTAHGNRVVSLAFSPDPALLPGARGGPLLASTSSDEIGTLWRVDGAESLLALDGHEGSISCVAFSPDGSRVATGSADRTVRLWSVRGDQQAVLRGHAGAVLSVAFSPDGATVASGSIDGAVMLWDAATGARAGTLTGHEGTVHAVAFSPRGALLASASADRTVRLWDTATRREVAVLAGHRDAVEAVAFSPDGSRLASGSADRTIRIWDTATGLELALLRGHDGGVAGLAYSPDGSRLASASSDQTIGLWDADEVAALPGHQGSVYAVAFSPDGSRLATGSVTGSVRLWDAARGRQIAALPQHDAAVHAVAFSPDGRLLASGSADTTVKLWDAGNGDAVTDLGGQGSVVLSVTFSPDGRKLAAGTGAGSIRLWDTAGFSQVAQLGGGGGGVYALAFSPDGAVLASASEDRTIDLWDTATGDRLDELRGHDGIVYCVAFSPDGGMVASGSHDGTIRLWEAGARREVAVLRPDPGSIYGVAFSPDGSRLASASADRTVQLWDIATGRQVAVLRGHEGPVHAVAFSPDGARLASASGDKTVRLWTGAATRRPAEPKQARPQEAADWSNPDDAEPW